MNTEQLYAHAERVQQVLQNNSDAFASVYLPSLKTENVCVMDFTESNERLMQTDLQNEGAFDSFVFDEMQELGGRVGVGGYGEDRVIYRRSEHFEEAEEARSVHLGVDLWVLAGEKIYAPIDAKVHSFADNDVFGDYGPTIILEHELDGVLFYTLYGHLNKECLNDLYVGKKIQKGDFFAEVGAYAVNGNWPAHLHFQVMSNLLGKSGDFPGVAAPSESEHYLKICPDPNYILQIPALKK